MKRLLKENKNGSYSYNSTQFRTKYKNTMISLQKNIDPFTIYTDPDDSSYGLENDLHITLCYGLKYKSDSYKLQSLFSDFGAVSVEYGKVSRFSPEDKPYDVLIVEVFSEDLQKMNKIIRDIFKPEITYLNYTPHLTLGYVMKGTNLDLDGADLAEGLSETFTSFIFMDKNKSETTISLKQGLIFENDSDKILIKELEIDIKELEIRLTTSDSVSEKEDLKQRISDLKQQITDIKNSMNESIIEEPRRLIKVRLIYQGNNTWQLKPTNYKNGLIPRTQRDIIFRGDEEKIRKYLISIGAKDTETEPATMRKDSYKHMVQVAKDNGSNMIWVWSNKWKNSNKII